MKSVWFLLGAVFSLTALSVTYGSVAPVTAPAPSRVTDDSAIYQNLSEIRVPRQGSLNFDQDLKTLVRMESRYREKLPALDRSARLRGPMKRISEKRYQYSGTKSARPTQTPFKARVIVPTAPAGVSAK